MYALSTGAISSLISREAKIVMVPPKLCPVTNIFAVGYILLSFLTAIIMKMFFMESITIGYILLAADMMTKITTGIFENTVACMMCLKPL